MNFKVWKVKIKTYGINLAGLMSNELLKALDPYL